MTDAALVRGTELDCSVQYDAGVDWLHFDLGPEYGGVLGPCTVEAGDVLHVVGRKESGPRRVTKVDESFGTVELDGLDDGIALATRFVEPDVTARLTPRYLASPGPDSDKIAQWVKKVRKRRKLPVAVGEIHGTFGGGIDRVMVFERKLRCFLDETPEGECDDWGEVAVLLEGSTPRGFLPFGGPDEDGDWDDGAWALQTVGVTDLDGDGVQEVVWLLQQGEVQDCTSAELVYFAAGEFHRHSVWACCSCHAALIVPRPHCRGTCSSHHEH